MTQLKTYSRKTRLIDSSEGAYNSSQESFFDSPDDPYFFDSQRSTGQAPPPPVDNHSSLVSTSSERSATAAFSSASQLPAAPVVPDAAAHAPTVHTRQALPATYFRSTQTQSVKSRLSHSSSDEARSASAIQANQKRSRTSALPEEGPAPKKARLKRSSSSSINQAHNSINGSSRDRMQPAPATTVLEVMSLRYINLLLTYIMVAAVADRVYRHKKAGNIHRLWTT
ncbi:hypothetical protein ABBQ38_009368 [Trebouxia sp. C0009 RCD-2024]